MPMLIALASPPFPHSLDDGLRHVERMTATAAAKGAAIACFPEAYLPGLRGVGFDVAPFTGEDEARAIEAVGEIVRAQRIATIVGLEHVSDAGPQIAAAVFNADGTLQGIQAKTQIAPEEDGYYVPGSGRRLFDVNGVPFGITICHEGFRYPEATRWAAARGAQIVFHPHCAVADHAAPRPTTWGAPENAYYEKAMLMRSIENSIYFASVNYALEHPDAATSLIDPSGRLQAYLPYGAEGVLVEALDLRKATGLLAKRYAPARYVEVS
jgi:predicted amidohydrolase